MIEKCVLSSFIAEEKKCKKTTEVVINSIYNNKKKYPKLFLLIMDTAKFCEKYFNDLLVLVRREKRLLGFQTPNRINFNHEYTLAKNQLESDFYYLFTPSGRLDWLTISVEGERVSIADKSIVMDKIFYHVKDEISNLKLDNKIGDNHNEILSILYENLSGLPCFIEYNKTENLSKQQSIIITIEYFESITAIENNNILLPFMKLFNPLLEKKITYRYAPLSSNYSSWLYLNSPKNFEISCNISDSENNIETAKTKDPEIASFVIKGNGKSRVYIFEILVSVPKSLKVWYQSLYYLSLIYLLGIFLYIFDRLNIFSKIPKLHFMCFSHNSISLFDKSTISNVSLAIIAGIIATRGWLIIEENVLRNISIKFTYILVIFIIMTILISYI